MPRIDVRAIPEPMLIRLHLVAASMMTDPETEEPTDWRQIAAVTEREIKHRGVSPEYVRFFGILDAEPRQLIVAAFRERQQRERCHRRN